MKSFRRIQYELINAIFHEKALQFIWFRTGLELLQSLNEYYQKFCIDHEPSPLKIGPHKSW